jgi:hypothetical protein
MTTANPPRALVVDLKTAKEIGVHIPANFELRADKVIE